MKGLTKFLAVLMLFGICNFGTVDYSSQKDQFWDKFRESVMPKEKSPDKKPPHNSQPPKEGRR